jgi:hypothetical protein
MGLYVEVMCDRRLPWPNGERGHIINRCYSDRNDNPQGHTVAQARKAAKKQGWLIESGGYCVCPNCRKVPVQAISDEETP